MSTKETIFYDLPSRQGNAWSLNPWKTRLALNYKSIAYKTEWVEYPSIAPKFKAVGVPPNAANPHAEYSIPVVQFPDGTYVMDSFNIAKALEKLQPQPPLHLDNGYVERAMQAIDGIQKALTPLLIPRVPTMLLNEASQPYFEETRAKRFGMSLAEYERLNAGEQLWKEVEPALQQLKALVNENVAGPFIAGDHVSYADFIVVGAFKFYERIDKQGDLFDRIMATDQGFRKLYEACGKWLERDDH